VPRWPVVVRDDRLGTGQWQSVDNYFTRQYIPEDNSEHHTRRRENLKSHAPYNSLNQKTVSGIQFPAKFVTEMTLYLFIKVYCL
jgi:hypothetical protein